MAEEIPKKPLKLKSHSHPVMRDGDSHLYHYHKKIQRDRDFSDHNNNNRSLPKSPPPPKLPPKIGNLDSSKIPRPPQPPSSRPENNNIIKKPKESGIDSSKKGTGDVRAKPSVKEQGKASMESSSKVKAEVSNTPKKRSSSSNAKDKEKKVYSLPGQKHDPPEERDPLRIFYESLYEQIPSSEMATIWMMEHGLLSPEAARKAYERKQKKQQQQRTGTPIKPSSVSEKKNSFKGDSKENTKSMKKSLSYDDDDFIAQPPKKKLR